MKDGRGPVSLSAKAALELHGDPPTQPVLRAELPPRAGKTLTLSRTVSDSLGGDSLGRDLERVVICTGPYLTHGPLTRWAGRGSPDPFEISTSLA